MQASISQVRGSWRMAKEMDWLRDHWTSIGLGGILTAIATVVGHYFKGFWSWKTKSVEKAPDLRRIEAEERHTEAEDGLASRRAASEEWMALVKDLRTQVESNRLHSAA